MTKTLIAASLFSCFASNDDLIWIYFNTFEWKWIKLMHKFWMHRQLTIRVRCTCTCTWNIIIKRTDWTQQQYNNFVWYQLLLNWWLSTFCILYFSFYRIIVLYIFSFLSSEKSMPHRYSSNLNYRFQFNVQQLVVKSQDGKPARQTRRSRRKRKQRNEEKMVNCSLAWTTIPQYYL